ncbi:MAG: Spy/CpxP family protein refolding chaperone [Acaryochloridaceae cyanobacterium CSU_3_4]|nr:Spy/CpxP family protein refolding chaperone [Acaryochloridaceae cyanobacterium CSU_3_4]
MKFRSIYLLAALPLCLPVYSTLTHADAGSLFPSYALAQAAGEPTNPNSEAPNKEEFKQRRQEQFRQALNLTPEQVTKIDQIREQGKQARQTQREAYRAAKEKMQTLMASDAGDDELRFQHRVLQDLRQKMGEARFENKLKIRSILTPEQRTKMVELQKQHKGRWGHRQHGQDGPLPE